MLFWANLSMRSDNGVDGRLLALFGRVGVEDTLPDADLYERAGEGLSSR